jgi:site-specific recombinase XerD
VEHGQRRDRRPVAGQRLAVVAALLDDGAAPATARSRQLAVRRFSAWLAEEQEIPVDALLGVKAPKLDTKVVEPLTEDEMKLMLKACTGPDLRERRDEALFRLMVETGARAGQVVAISIGDVDLAARTAIVRRGKGGKGRVVPFGPQTAKAIDRYIGLDVRTSSATPLPTGGWRQADRKAA